MNYFNQNNNNLAQQFFPKQQTPKIDQAQFASVAATLDDNSLSQLISLARQKGISEQDINSGVSFVKSFRR